MTIADELAERGHLGGPATIEMLTARWRSATRPMYVLEPAGGWDDDNRLDLLHEFLGERLKKLTDALVTIGADEEALLKVTSRIMKHWLIDQARKTDSGAIRLRLEELLNGGAMFLRLPGHAHRWALAGTTEAEGGRGDEGSLIAAARAVPDVKLVRWRDDNRRAPMASGEDLTRVLTAVLACAGPGGVETGVLTHVFQRRFSVSVSLDVPLDADDSLGERLSEVTMADLARESVAVARAAEVDAQLSDRERRILLHLDDRRAVELTLKVGRSVAYTLIARVRATLAVLAGEDLDAATLAAAPDAPTQLVQLAQAQGVGPLDEQGVDGRHLPDPGRDRPGPGLDAGRCADAPSAPSPKSCIHRGRSATPRQRPGGSVAPAPTGPTGLNRGAGGCVGRNGASR